MSETPSAAKLALLIPQGVEQRLRSLEQQLAITRAANRDSERRCFEATQRGQQLASDFGFSDVAAAEDAILSKPHLYNRATIDFNASQVATLEEELRQERVARQQEASTHRELLESLTRLREENERLKLSEGSSSAQPVSRPKPSEEAPALLAVKSQELFALQTKYDALLENQQHLLKKHKDSIARYKRMKNYMFKISNDGVGGMPLDDGAEMDNESDLELPPCAAPSVSHNLAVPKTPRKNTKRTPCTPKSGRSTLGHAPLAQNVVNSPHRRSLRTPRRRQRASSPQQEDMAVSVVNVSQTQGESQAFPMTDPVVRVHYSPTTSRMRRLSAGNTAQDATRGHSLLQSFVNPPALLVPKRGAKRKTESDDEIIDLTDSTPTKLRESPTSGRTAAPKRKHEDMDTAHASSDSSHTEPDSQAPESPPPRPQHLSPRRRSRRHSTAALPGSPSSSRKAGKRPRHSEPAHRADAENADAPSSSRLKTVNAQYEINPAANRGRAFQYDEVVRGKQHRHALGATSCDDCRDYYAAVGPLPPRLHAPAWRTPPSSPVHSRDRGHPEHGIRQHQKEISRHRAQWPRPPTPPGYWDIGFPDTQEATAINAQAAKMHEQKFAQIAREAEREGGRYRRRE